MTDERDRREKLELANMHVPMARCIGGHVVHKTYTCPWCGSHDPGQICFEENIRTASEKPADYDPKLRKQIKAMRVVP